MTNLITCIAVEPTNFFLIYNRLYSLKASDVNGSFDVLAKQSQLIFDEKGKVIVGHNQHNLIKFVQERYIKDIRDFQNNVTALDDMVVYDVQALINTICDDILNYKNREVLIDEDLMLCEITNKPNNNCAYLMFYGKIFKIKLNPINGIFNKAYHPMRNTDVLKTSGFIIDDGVKIKLRNNQGSKDLIDFINNNTVDDVAVDLTHLISRDEIYNEMTKSTNAVIQFKISQNFLEGV